jgi:hypothetical protein
MRGKLLFTALAVAILAVFASMSLAGAETIKFRQVQFITKAEVIQVGDVPDHIIGIYDQTGLASFDTGEVASLKNPGTLDYIKGTGAIQGYTTYTFEDGSTRTGKWQGTTRPDPGGKGSWFEGTWTFIQGTGRWAGIQGEGTFIGRRFVPFGGAAQIYTDNSGTYTLPSR